MNTQEQLAEHFGRSEETYQKTPLYGGAITADLPTSFADVSTIRQIPDNQEVYLHRTQLYSIVFDILERVAPPDHPCATDEQALLYHFKDITEEGHVREGTESEEESKIWESGRITVPGLGAEVPAYNLFATQNPQAQPPAAARSGKPPVDFTGILMTLIRLESRKTDLVFCVNVPHAQGEYDAAEIDFGARKVGRQLAAAEEYQTKVLESLKIEDWSLFVQE